MEFIKITEQPSLYNDLEKKPIGEILQEINAEDHKVADRETGQSDHSPGKERRTHLLYGSRNKRAAGSTGCF